MPRNTAQQNAPDRQFLRPGQAGIEDIAQRNLQAGDRDRHQHERHADRLQHAVDDARKAVRHAVRRRTRGRGVRLCVDVHGADLSRAPGSALIISAVSGLFDPKSLVERSRQLLHLCELFRRQLVHFDARAS